MKQHFQQLDPPCKHAATAASFFPRKRPCSQLFALSDFSVSRRADAPSLKRQGRRHVARVVTCMSSSDCDRAAVDLFPVAASEDWFAYVACQFNFLFFLITRTRGLFSTTRSRLNRSGHRRGGNVMCNLLPWHCLERRSSQNCSHLKGINLVVAAATQYADYKHDPFQCGQIVCLG